VDSFAEELAFSFWIEQRQNLAERVKRDRFARGPPRRRGKARPGSIRTDRTVASIPTARTCVPLHGALPASAVRQRKYT
jgi:hypothetical protein